MPKEGTYSCIFRSDTRWTYPTGIPGWWWNSPLTKRNKTLASAKRELESCLRLVREGSWRDAQIVRTG